jgi:hypothetical protein
MQYHKILEKQIQKTLSEQQLNDPAIQQLLKLVDRSYKNFESDQQLTEHAFLVSEKEYQDILHTLQHQNNIFSQSVKKLKVAIIAHDPQAAVIHRPLFPAGSRNRAVSGSSVRTARSAA